MAFELPLPRGIRKQGWRVKIRDKERLEPPHVTIIFRTRTWRINLRDRSGMDEGSWKDIPSEVKDVVEARWDELKARWDEIYPDNPIESAEDDDDS